MFIDMLIASSTTINRNTLHSLIHRGIRPVFLCNSKSAQAALIAFLCQWSFECQTDRFTYADAVRRAIKYSVLAGNISRLQRPIVHNLFISCSLDVWGGCTQWPRLVSVSLRPMRTQLIRRLYRSMLIMITVNCKRANLRAICYSAYLYAIARPSVCPSVRPSHGW